MNIPQADVIMAHNTVFDCTKSLDWFGFVDWINWLLYLPQVVYFMSG